MKHQSELKTNVRTLRYEAPVLPVGVNLYLAAGVRGVFRCAGVNDTSPTEATWLYVPPLRLQQLEDEIRESGISESHRQFWPHPVDVDEFALYPIVMNGAIKATLLFSEGCQADLAEVSEEQVIQFVTATSEDSTEQFDLSYASGFIAGLVEGDAGFDHALKTILHQLLGCHARGIYAAVYSRKDTDFRLRVSAGDISLSGLLRTTMTDDCMKKWTRLQEGGVDIVPAEVLPDYPLLMNNPPYFVALRPGPRSARTEYLIAAAFRGDNNLRCLEHLSKLISQIDEAQFASSSELVGWYREMAANDASHTGPIDLLRRAFELLEREIGSISRLELIRRDSCSYSVGRSDNGQLMVKERAVVVMPGNLDQLLNHQSFVLRPSVTNDMDGGNRTESGSEYYVSLPGLGGDRLGVLMVASGKEGEHLGLAGKAIMDLATILGYKLYLMSMSTDSERTIGIDSGNESIDHLYQRFSTIRKLTGGYFHSLLGNLAVTIGQTDLLDSVVDSSVDIISERMVKEATGKIGRVADDLSTGLINLRSILDIDREGMNGLISGAGFIRNINEMTRGFQRQILDTKNIRLRIKTDVPDGVDLNFRYGEVFDYILPLMLSLMEEAICSGEVTVCLESSEGADRLRFAFPSNIIGQTELGEFIRRVYPYDQVCTVADGSGLVAVNGRVTICFDTENIDMNQVCFGLQDSTPELIESTCLQPDKGLIE